ncbi:hypothetical protein LY632_12045 [Erythrobacter sp. SDW2]|uniref:hypothetical protein n=1 Tax=Erythrobacter sp. SDW2 TaxID=2907154 RepID=UPI001F39F342|nr:hypothetical protein [Erythrobacter sp. SDW2]UIP06414.1 hypothetical protein LY632_12045 [Erythrobacter sp. SDW2]
MKTLFGRLVAACLVFCLALPLPAYAKWHVAESDNFVIYAEEDAERLGRFVEVLERYHAALGAITGRAAATPSPSNRLTIFSSGSREDIRKLYGGSNRFISAFYLPRAGDAVAFIPALQGSRDEMIEAQTALLHEYAHHYLAITSRYPMPLWFSEGAAEYFASAGFHPDGRVEIGLPAGHRIKEVFVDEPLPVRELLDPDRYGTEIGKRYESYYGKAWLLYHLLMTDPEREGQLDRYAEAIRSGARSIDAAAESFGDLAVLERALHLHSRTAAWEAIPIVFEPGELEVREYRVTELSDGAAAILPLVIQSKRGVAGEDAQRVAADARAIASAYPDDAFVLAALAEAELDAGNGDAAIAAADRATAIDPLMRNAYVQKGIAMFRLAAAAEDKDSATVAAMAPLEALNALEPDHPTPLVYFYLSFAQRGYVAPVEARQALEQAAELALFDRTLWLSVGIAQAREGKIALARQSLRPVALDPHGGENAATAMAMLELLETAVEGQPFRP